MRLVPAVAVLLLAPRAVAQEVTGDSPLPEGGSGVAARHPGDAGIARDPAVLFHDDFETVSTAADLAARWDAGVYHLHCVRIAMEPENRHAGGRALEFRVPRQPEELSNTVAKSLAVSQETLFLRYYTRFDGGFDHVGSSHNGATISARYFVDGAATPGVRADGRNKFLASFENWRGEASTKSPGGWAVYCYHPEQKDRFGDLFLPSGTVFPNSHERSGERTFGRGFVARPDRIPELGRWYCHEFMVRANAPGRRDGRIACWIDGELIADYRNLRLRDAETLRIDRFSLDLHIGSNAIRENRKWYDDVVAATSYVGPMAVGDAR